jgi:hypothetical protein
MPLKTRKKYAPPPIVRTVAWISVKETLPDDELTVLIYSKTDDTVEQGFLDAGFWFYASGGGAGNVTHWMNLPDPPGWEAA